MANFALGGCRLQGAPEISVANRSNLFRCVIARDKDRIVVILLDLLAAKPELFLLNLVRVDNELLQDGVDVVRRFGHAHPAQVVDVCHHHG